MTTILGIKLTNRTKTAPIFQQILSKYGCNIKSRIGLHDVKEGVCSPDGIILLEVIGDDKTISDMLSELKSIEDIKLEKMIL